MCICQLAVVLWLGAGRGSRLAADLNLVLAAFLAAVLVVALLAMRRFDQVGKLTSRTHLEEVSDLIKSKMAAAVSAPASSLPLISRTSLGVVTAVSREVEDGLYHVSVSLPGRARDLPLLFRLIAWSVPGAAPSTVVTSDGGVIHCLARNAPAPSGNPPSWLKLYAAALRRDGLPTLARPPKSATR